MHPGYIAGYVIFLLVMVVVAIFLYAYKTYSSNRVFTKPKMPIIALIILGLLIVCFSLIGGYFAWNLTSEQPVEGAMLHVAFSFVLVGLCLIYLIAFITITKVTSKNKIDYLSINKINWKQKLINLQNEVKDMEKLKQVLATKHKKYYYQMLSYYETILNNAKNKGIKKEDQVADIVTFNDAFSYKWSKKLNAFLLLLTYQYCALFQKKFSQN